MRIKRIQKKKHRNSTIKTRLLVLPIILLLVAILIIAFSSSISAKRSLEHSIKDNGFLIADTFEDTLGRDAMALNTIQHLLNDKILSIGTLAVLEENNLSNVLLESISLKMDVAEINAYDYKGNIIYSNTQGNIGFQAKEDHIIFNLIKGNDDAMYEEIRENLISDKSYKYGYIKGSNYIIQVGLDATEVEQVTQTFEYQSIINELIMNEDITYVSVVNNTNGIIASSMSDAINTKLDNVATKQALGDGIPYSSISSYASLEDSLHIMYPLTIGEEHIGAIALGLKMDTTNQLVKSNIVNISIIGLTSLLLLGLLLYTVSTDTIRVIFKLEEQIHQISLGNLQSEIPAKILKRRDEFGKIALSVKEMKRSLTTLIQTIQDKSQQLSSTAEELYASTKQSSYTSDEITRAISQIASGAMEQSDEISQGSLSISELGQKIEHNNIYVNELDESTTSINTMIHDGFNIITELVTHSNSNTTAAQEVESIIITTNDSVKEIANASDMIKSIAEQTNLLALNATIEAARAGESGKGFAVVASEIRKLADESSLLSSQISHIISNLTSKTEYAMESMKKVGVIVQLQSNCIEKTNEKFQSILESVDEMKKIDSSIKSSSEQMNTSKEIIIGIMNGLSAISEENAASSEETTASVEEQSAALEEISQASEDLAHISEELSVLVQRFKLGQ